MLQDPYPVYAAMRANDPAHWSERLNSWVFTRHTDCAQLLQDTDRFTSDFRRIGEEPPAEVLSIQTVDPPDHVLLRRPILTALRELDLKRWATNAVQTGAKLLGEVDHTGFDFVTEFAEPLAAAAMSALFGIPLDRDLAAFRNAQRDLVLSMDYGLAPERLTAGNRARRYLSSLVDPAINSDHTAGSLLGRIDWDTVGDERPLLINSLRAIFVAGYSSAGSMLVNAVHTLVAAGSGNTKIGATAFHELVRFEGAVQATSRAVISDSELGGQPLRRGDVVVAVIGSANRDPDAFADPDVLHLDRAHNPHLGFGRGIHACLGTRIALLLGMQILNLLFENHEVELNSEPVRRPSATIRTLDHLPISRKPR
jgi:cytochrome P450